MTHVSTEAHGNPTLHPVGWDSEQLGWLQTTTIPRYGGYHDPHLPDTQPIEISAEFPRIHDDWQFF
jgi:hypothetical protein